MTTTAEAIANGAALLDEQFPGWWRQINVGQLQLSDCNLCILGQIYRPLFNELCANAPSPGCRPEDPYAVAQEDLELSNYMTTQYGFNLDYYEAEGCHDWGMLTDAWIELIKLRFEEDTLDEHAERS